MAPHLQVVTKGFEGKDECCINFEPTQFGHMGLILYAASVDQWMLCLIRTFFYISNKWFCFCFFFNHLNEWNPCNRANTVWMSTKTRNKEDWVSWAMQQSRLYLSVPFTDVVLLDCPDWHCVAFALCCRNAHWQKVFFLKAVDIFALCLFQVTQHTVLWMTSLTRRASHQPCGSVSCTCLSSMYLLSIMLLSWYLCAFLLCPSPSVACCSDSMVLFPLLAPI